MDLMTLVLSCAFPVVNDRFVESIAMVQSGGEAHYVRPYGELTGIKFSSTGQAGSAIDRIIERPQGGAYVGLMGVPVAAAAKYEVGPKALLDPCTNIRVGSAILTDIEAQCKAEGREESATCILARYAVMTEQEPGVFVETVLYGAIEQLNEDGSFPGPQAAEGDRVFWESNSTRSRQNVLFFDVDLGETDAESKVKTARDLDE
ncbi:MAG: lytic transglycosylase domain-containing protein [Gammaproteobacteria bacterium]|nr:lytic transglycosylase domain-containing protein [Gammaproteobacteria bacterium]